MPILRKGGIDTRKNKISWKTKAGLEHFTCFIP